MSALHSDIHGAIMMRKRVIDEPQNLIHNVVPKRADIGRCTPDNARLSAFQLEWLIKRHSNCRNLAEAVDKYYAVSEDLSPVNQPPQSGQQYRGN